MLGFHPENSCVVLALSGDAVAFCARLELDWFVVDYEGTLAQLCRAADRVPDCRYVVIGYGPVDDAALAVTELSDCLGWPLVAEALVTQGDYFWSLPALGEPTRFSFDCNPLAASAVYEGMRIERDRATAVLPVVLSEPPEASLLAQCEGALEAMSAEVGFAVLESLAESPLPLKPADAVLLALLLRDEDRLAALVARLNRTSAVAIWPNLVLARRHAPPQAEADVLASLCLASWLAGKPAGQIACLEQLLARDADHPLALMLVGLQQAGVSPDQWPW